MLLQRAGWDKFWEEKFADLAGQGLKPARVLAQYRNSYSVWTVSGEADAEVAGALLYRADAGGLPVVGDWVAVRQYAPADVAIITEVLPRRTKFSRKSSGSTQQEQVIAANIDLLFTVCGLDHDYNLRRLERYLVAGEQSGARPVIVLNKAIFMMQIWALIWRRALLKCKQLRRKYRSWRFPLLMQLMKQADKSMRQGQAQA
jgi:ribosome biogenesis GTPase